MTYDEMNIYNNTDVIRLALEKYLPLTVNIDLIIEKLRAGIEAGNKAEKSQVRNKEAEKSQVRNKEAETSQVRNKEDEIIVNTLRSYLSMSLEAAISSLLAEDANQDEIKERIGYILRMYVAMATDHIVADITNQAIEKITKLKTSQPEWWRICL